MTTVVVMLLAATQIIAHRGASYDAPENTLTSVELAWERDADAVEVDIFLSRDGKIVVIHDDTTKRLAGVDKAVADQTLAELKALDVGRWKGPEFAGTRIPTLAEVLETVPDGKRLVIEVKGGEAILPELERVVDASGKRGQVLYIAFGYGVIRAAKRRMPDVPAYWLYGWNPKERIRWGDPSPERLIALATAAGLDGLDVNYKGAFGADFAKKLEAAGMKLVVYTVNDPESARRLAAMGVAGITTDRPAFLAKEIGGAASDGKD